MNNLRIGSSDPEVKIAIIAYQGVDELDLFGAYSVLAKAAQESGTLGVRIVAATNKVIASGGAVIQSQAELTEATKADAVVVPGGRGSAAASADSNLQAVLRTAVANGARLYTVCSGLLPVAAAGLAQGHRVAIHHGKVDALSSGSVRSVEVGLVRDRTLCSVGGDASSSVKSVDLAFALLDDLTPGLTAVVAKRMEIIPGRLS